MPALSLFDTPPLHRLRDCERILVAGAGGGFDVLSGLPMAFALREQGKSVMLANLTFTPVARAEGAELFVNPLMSMVWGFDFDTVAERCSLATISRTPPHHSKSPRQSKHSATGRRCALAERSPYND